MEHNITTTKHNPPSTTLTSLRMNHTPTTMMRITTIPNTNIHIGGNGWYYLANAKYKSTIAHRTYPLRTTPHTSQTSYTILNNSINTHIDDIICGKVFFNQRFLFYFISKESREGGGDDRLHVSN